MGRFIATPDEMFVREAQMLFGEKAKEGHKEMNLPLLLVAFLFIFGGVVSSKGRGSGSSNGCTVVKADFNLPLRGRRLRSISPASR